MLTPASRTSRARVWSRLIGPIQAAAFAFTLLTAIPADVGLRHFPTIDVQDASGTQDHADTDAHDDPFTRQDRLRGSITPERAWWDLLHYELRIQIYPDLKQLAGSNAITFRVLEPHDRMQIDLQPPLNVRRITHNEAELTFEREGNVYWVDFAEPLAANSEQTIRIFYDGNPTESRNPPWSGGFTWKTDELGNPFIATTCQGIGASIWWPCKDHCYDEPDRGMDIRLVVPEQLTAVSNGRLISTQPNEDARTRTFHWQVTQPINNYAVNANIGVYDSASETFEGEAGPLDIEYWMLAHQREQAIEHFAEVPRTLEAFEHWFGPYPFYEDGYKLVVVPYLGMEHQSSVTYGNGFQNGYRGRDLSRTGVGMKFDFIIVHETAHEWFGNNITARDIADMWIHESFANYAECLFVEYHFAEKEAQDYVIGCRALISNNKPIIGVYNVNKAGSGDMYYKGGNMLHTMRHMLNDDATWRSMLRGLNEQFRHQTVTTQQIEDAISRMTGFDYAPVFAQYLRDTRIPALVYTAEGNTVTLRWEDVVDGFAAPVVVSINNTPRRIHIDAEPVTITLDEPFESLELDRNFYMKTRAE